MPTFFVMAFLRLLPPVIFPALTKQIGLISTHDPKLNLIDEAIMSIVKIIHILDEATIRIKQNTWSSDNEFSQNKLD